MTTVRGGCVGCSVFVAVGRQGLDVFTANKELSAVHGY